MIKMRKWISVFFSAAIFMSFPSMKAEAAREKIDSVSVDIESEIKIGQKVDEGDISVKAGSEAYRVGKHKILNDAYIWEEEDEPVLEIRLYAEDGYYFSLMDGDVTIQGVPAELMTMKRENASTTLVITILMDPVDYIAGFIEDVRLESTGLAYWSPSKSVTGYEVRLYKDGMIQGQTKYVETNLYNFASSIKAEDIYRVAVRGINKEKDGSKETGRWVQSNRLFITPDTLDEDAMPPEDVEVQGEWRENDNGRWYRYPDGSYPKNTWVSIFGEKYFFDEKGYMVTGWVTWKDKEYYCGDDGVMLVNTVTPDGERVGPDGSRQ